MCGHYTELELGTVCHSTVIVGIPAASRTTLASFRIVRNVSGVSAVTALSAQPRTRLPAVQKWKLAQFYDISPVQKLGGARQRGVARYCRQTIIPAASRGGV